MKIRKFLTGDFCVWVVPPDEGRIKKIRFTARRVAWVVGLGSLVAFLAVAIVSDYGRVQTLRLQNYLELQYSNWRMRSMEEKFTAMQSEFEQIQRANDRLAGFNQDVKQRLELLSNLLSGAVGTDAAPFHSPTDASNDSGIGGAEVDCLDGGCDVGLPRFQEMSGLVGRYPPGEEGSVAQAATLVTLLERNIDVLRLLPIGLPGNGYINSPFGKRISPFNRRTKMHEGVDIALPSGSLVSSTGDGVVESVRRTSTYGLVIDIRHTPKLVTRYAHLSRAIIKQGERVCRGERIALVGSTGHSTGPHLHYEVLLDGKQIDPSPLIGLADDLRRVFQKGRAA